jgi:hypothetical protein
MRMYSPVPTANDKNNTPIKDQDADTVRTIGIVDDNLDPALIEGLIEYLREELPSADVRTWIKPSGTAPAPEELIDEMVGEVDFAIAAIAMCGSCTAGVVLDATRLHKRGIPTQAISWEIFERAARSMATLQGVPELPLVIMEQVKIGDTPEDQHRKGRGCGEKIVASLRTKTPVGVAGGN